MLRLLFLWRAHHSTNIEKLQRGNLCSEQQVNMALVADEPTGYYRGVYRRQRNDFLIINKFDTCIRQT